MENNAAQEKIIKFSQFFYNSVLVFECQGKQGFENTA